MIEWMCSRWRPARPPSAPVEDTLSAMRETRELADDLAAGNVVTPARYRHIEAKLTGNVVEDHLTGRINGRYP